MTVGSVQDCVLEASSFDITAVMLPEQAVVTQQAELQTRLQQLGEVAGQLPSLARLMDELDRASQQFVAQGRAQVDTRHAPKLLLPCEIW
jgi:hypothetical protein